MRFTDRSIAALKPKAERYEVWEDGRTGLGVRVSPKSRKSWIYMYRFAGKARRMGLGTYPLVSLASAGVKHARAKELLAEDIEGRLTCGENLRELSLLRERRQDKFLLCECFPVDCWGERANGNFQGAIHKRIALH